MASFGMGEGFTDTSPHSNSPNLLSFSTINDYQQIQHDISMLDKCLVYESTSMHPFPYLGMDEYNNMSDFDCGSNTLRSLSTYPEPGAWLHTFGSESVSVEMFTFEHTSTDELVSTPSDSMQDPESFQFGISDASQENSRSRSMAGDPAPSSSCPFICDAEDCSRSYRRIHELRRHKRVHLNTKQFACRFTNCKRSGQKGFTRKDHLKQHLRQVHGASL